MLASTASSTPSALGKVNGVAGIPGKEVAQWSVQDVLAYFDCLELGHMKSVINAQGIDGCMLVEFVRSETDMLELGFPTFQSKKSKQRLPRPYDISQLVACIRSSSSLWR